ncbi:MAG: thermonuclease family protein [Cycloclasticus sp.]|nr:thermonuclease family protein [Cycloclasticus sp.]MBQ0790804.1 thermonuclease family protein [Cycloclasticus sp.]
MIQVDSDKSVSNCQRTRFACAVNLIKTCFLVVCVVFFYDVYAKPIKQVIKVIKVIDGDTVVLNDGRTVRLLSINTPEMAGKGRLAEPGARLAKRKLTNVLLNQRVYLEYDVEKKDKYGRTLAFVFLLNGVHVNALMLQEGLAVLSLHPPNLKHMSSLIRAQINAETAGIGLWGMADYQPIAVSTLGTKAKGHWRRISGTIQRIELFKSGAKLWLAPSTYIWLYRSNIKYFPAIEHYQGKNIEVRTWVKKRQNVWSLPVRHPSQLIVKP